MSNTAVIAGARVSAKKADFSPLRFPRELLLFDYATKRPLSKADAFKAYEYMYERRHKIDENIDAKAYEWSLLK